MTDVWHSLPHEKRWQIARALGHAANSVISAAARRSGLTYAQMSADPLTLMELLRISKVSDATERAALRRRLLRTQFPGDEASQTHANGK